MTLALFDLDNTLLSGDSDYSWGAFLSRTGRVNATEYAERNQQFYDQYVAGQLDIHAYCHFVLGVLKDHDQATLTQWHQEFMHADILPMISQKARQKVEEHRQQGHTLMIITASNRFITAPIAAEFGIEYLLAIDPEIENGHFTGRIVGIPTLQEGKVTRLTQWLAQHPAESLEGSYFYSDSHNDLPLLKQVTHPVAVDPDDTLHQYANEQGWPIISLRNDVS